MTPVRGLRPALGGRIGRRPKVCAKFPIGSCRERFQPAPPKMTKAQAADGGSQAKPPAPEDKHFELSPAFGRLQEIQFPMESGLWS